MVYVMKFYVDGACRGNGQPGAIGAASACLFTRHGKYYTKTCSLARNNPVPTNQRAEIFAIVLALEWALEKYDKLSHNPYIDVTIHSDSRHAVDSMTKFIHKWTSNGWYNAAGKPVKNKGLLQRALELENEISSIGGEVTYKWISRKDNKEADEACNDWLNQM